jgi:hypothetical protein
MTRYSERFQWLARQFDALVKDLNASASMEEQRELFRRMKVLIDEIDALISFSTGEGQDTQSSLALDQPRVE